MKHVTGSTTRPWRGLLAITLLTGGCGFESGFLEDNFVTGVGATNYAIESAVILCHRDADGLFSVIRVPTAAAEAHRKHGDANGACIQRLVTPSPGSVVPQNSAFLQCPAHATRGYGIAQLFSWQAARDPQNLIIDYQIIVQRQGATIPMLDRTTAATATPLISCNSFVADFNLANWEWMVRARDASGNYGPWLKQTFSYAPCRLDNGGACHAN